jgi:ACT domain-containing protein
MDRPKRADMRGDVVVTINWYVRACERYGRLTHVLPGQAAKRVDVEVRLVVQQLQQGHARLSISINNNTLSRKVKEVRHVCTSDA